MEKSATLIAYLLSKLINEQGGIFRLLHEKLQAGWKGNLKNLSEHALLLGTSEYVSEILFLNYDTYPPASKLQQTKKIGNAKLQREFRMCTAVIR